MSEEKPRELPTFTPEQIAAFQRDLLAQIKRPDLRCPVCGTRVKFGCRCGRGSEHFEPGEEQFGPW